MLMLQWLAFNIEPDGSFLEFADRLLDFYIGYVRKIEKP